jgi:hypothetical protein
MVRRSLSLLAPAHRHFLVPLFLLRLQPCTLFRSSGWSPAVLTVRPWQSTAQLDKTIRLGRAPCQYRRLLFTPGGSRLSFHASASRCTARALQFTAAPQPSHPSALHRRQRPLLHVPRSSVYRLKSRAFRAYRHCARYCSLALHHPSEHLRCPHSRVAAGLRYFCHSSLVRSALQPAVLLAVPRRSLHQSSMLDAMPLMHVERERTEGRISPQPFQAPLPRR